MSVTTPINTKASQLRRMWSASVTVLALFLFAVPASAQTTVVFEPGVEGQIWKILSVAGRPDCLDSQRAPSNDGIWIEGRCDPNFGATITFAPNTLSYPMQVATDQPTVYLSNARAILPTPAALTPQDIINGNALNPTTGLVACINPLNIVNYVTDDYRLQAFDSCTNPVTFGVALGAELAASTVINSGGPFAQPGTVVYQHPSGTMTANGSIVGANGQFINNAEGVKVDAAHNIIITDRENARVLVFDQNGALLNSWSVQPAATTLGIPPLPLLPTGVSMTPGTVLGTAGSGYVAVLLGGAGASRLLIYDALGTFVTGNTTAEVCRGDFSSHLADGLCNPTDAWFDANGNLFVADIFNSRIAVYSFTAATRTLAFEYQFGGSADSTGAVLAPSDIAYPYSVALMQTVSGQPPRILVGDAGRQQMSIYQIGAPAPAGLRAGSQLVGSQLTNGVVVGTDPLTGLPILQQKVAGTTTPTLPDLYYLFFLNAKGDLNGNPRGVMQDKAGRLYAADTTNHLVRRWELPPLAVVQLSTSIGNTVNPDNTIATGGTFTSTVNAGAAFFVNGFGAVPLTKPTVLNVTPSIWAVDRLDAQGNPLGTDGQPLIVGGQVDLARLAVSSLVTPSATGGAPLPTGVQVYPTIDGGTDGLYYWNFTAASGITTPTPVVFIIGAVGDGGATVADVRTIAITIVCGTACGATTPVTTPVIGSTYWSLNGAAQSGTANNSAAWHSAPATVSFTSIDTPVFGTPTLQIASVRFRSSGVTPGSALGLPACREQYDPTTTWYCYNVPPALQAQTVTVPALSISANGSTTIYFSAVDVNGAIESEKSVVVLVDAVPPTVAFTATTAPNGFGWYRANVTVNWRAVDSQSGPGGTTLPTWVPANTLTSVSGTLPTYTVEGEGVTQGVNAADLVRNTSNWPYSVNIDKTSPVIATVPGMSLQSATPVVVTLPFISLGTVACPAGVLTPGTICDPTPTSGGVQSFIYTVTASATNAVTLTQDSAGWTGTFPLGTTSVTVRACDYADNCSVSQTQVTVGDIRAVDDRSSVVDGRVGGVTSIATVLGNDTLDAGTVPASVGNVTITTWGPVSLNGTSAPGAGITLATANGSLSVPAGTAPGSYTFPYTICRKDLPTACATATVTVPVTEIVALNDTTAVVDGRVGAASAVNVLTNDTTDRTPATVGAGGNVTITWSGLVSRNGGTATTTSGVTLDPLTGLVSVAPGTAAGTYTFTYTICEVNGPTTSSTICATATVTVPVTSIDAINDTGTAVVQGVGGTSFTNVLANDTLRGVLITNPALVRLSLVTSSDPGVTLSGTSVVVAPSVPAGTYQLTYQICEVANPTVCATAIVTVPVTVVTTPPVTPKITLQTGSCDCNLSGILWPPNHRLVTITAKFDGLDLLNNTIKLVSIVSNEPDAGNGGSPMGHRDGDGCEHDRKASGHKDGDRCDHDVVVKGHRKGDGDDHDKGLSGHRSGDACDHDLDVNGHRAGDGDDHDRSRNGHYDGDGCSHDAWLGLDIQTMTGKPISTVYGTDTRMFQLRAERFATGTGRTYTITYQVTNQYGNSIVLSATAFAPKDLSTVTPIACPKDHTAGDGDDHDRGINGHHDADGDDHDLKMLGHHQGDGDDHDLKKNGHKDGDGCAHDVVMHGHRAGDGDDHERSLNGHHAGDTCEHEKAMNRHFRGDGDDHDKGVRGHSKGDGCSHDIDLGGHHTSDNCEHERHANGHHNGDGCDHDKMDRDNDDAGKSGWFGATCRLGVRGESGSESDHDESHSKGDNCDHERGLNGHRQGDGCDHERSTHAKGDNCDHERGSNGHRQGDGCAHEKSAR